MATTPKKRVPSKPRTLLKTSEIGRVVTAARNVRDRYAQLMRSRPHHVTPEWDELKAALDALDA